MKRAITSVGLTVLVAVTLVAQQPDRSQRPVPGPPPTFKAPAIERRALSNGLPVWFVELHAVPVVEVSLLVLTGASADAPDRAGVASLTAALLDEGAGSRSALEIADEIDFLGASLSTGSTFDHSAVRLYVPSARLDASLAVMADVALRPTFPARDIERVREERLTALQQARDDPAWLASTAFTRLLYGPANRFGTPVTGSSESLKALGRSDLEGFQQTYYRPDNSVLLVAGDVRRAELLPMLESRFGSWTSNAPAVVAQSQSQQPRERRRIVLVDKPGAVQSEIRIGSMAAARTSPDFFTLQTLNSILGGAYTSRLNQNLRETHEYTYGAFSEFVFRRMPGPFIASSAVETARTADALREFFRELDRMHQPVDREELEQHKRYLSLSFPNEFETISDLIDKLEEIATSGLPLDYFDHYADGIQAVTVEDVRRAAETYLRRDRFLTVIVGDVGAIREPIMRLTLAPVAVMSGDAILGGQHVDGQR